MRLSPMPLATVREAFDDPDWLFEPKWDGFRALAYIDEHRCRLVSRRGNVFKSWPYLCEELAHAVRCQSAKGAFLCRIGLVLNNLREPPRERATRFVWPASPRCPTGRVHTPDE